MRWILALLTLALPVPSLAGGVGDLSLGVQTSSLSYTSDSRLKVELSTATAINVSLKATADTVLGKRYGASTGVLIKTGATEEALILVRNPAGSTKILQLSEQLFVSVDQGVNLLFRMYRNPTVTVVGSTATVSNLYIGGGFPTGFGIMNIAPTVTSYGTLLAVFQARDVPYSDNLSSRIVIAPGQSVLITIESSGNNKRWAYNLSWTEELP